MEELVNMNKKELKRAEIMPLIANGHISQIQAAKHLELSERQIRRLYQKYKSHGVKGLVSKKRGRASNNKLDEFVIEQVVNRIRERYPDFKPTFAHEKLTEMDNFDLSLSSVRNLMIEHELYKPKRVKNKRIHPRRERRSKFGELIQIDGSPHDWFEGRSAKCCLIVLIDDATSKLLGLHFIEEESIRGYFLAFKDYLSKHGRPLAVYSDKHAIFRVNHGCNMEGRLTQFGRAMKELDIKAICAHSPQAKGRVERANNTLQDRLVKEMRLRGISTTEEANSYLPEYIKDHNQRFSVEAQDPINAHRILDKRHNLEQILSIHGTRKISKTLSFQYENSHYQIIEEGWKARKLIGQRVDVYRTLEGKIRLYYKETKLTFTRSDSIINRPKILDSKTLNPNFERWLNKKKQYVPNNNHPYKRGFYRLN